MVALRLRTFTVALMLAACIALPPARAADPPAAVSRAFVDDLAVAWPENARGDAIPLRQAAEALGATVTWDPVTRNALIQRGDLQVRVAAGDTGALVGAQVIRLESPVRAFDHEDLLVTLPTLSQLLDLRYKLDPATETLRFTENAPTAGGTLTLSLTDDPSLFPLTSSYAPELLEQIYGPGLMRMGAVSLQPEPALASSFSISDDGLTYRFALRKDVTFHDGRPVTAKDFAFTYRILIHPDYKGSLRSGFSDYLESVNAVDDYTLELKLKAPFGPFLSKVTQVPPLPAAHLKDIPVERLDRDPFFRRPVGAGPFRFREWKGQQYIQLDRNPGYWEASVDPRVGPWIDRITYRILDPFAPFAMMLGDGYVDHARASSLEAFAEVKRWAPDAKGYTWDRMGVGMLMFNTASFPTSDPTVRRALTLALDRTKLVKEALGHLGLPNFGPLPRVHWSADPADQADPYDPEEAVRLLTASGYTRNASGTFEKDGRPLEITLSVARGFGVPERVAVIAQRSWREIGVGTTILAEPFGDLRGYRWPAGKFHAALMGLNVVDEPYDILRAYWHSENIRLNAAGRNSGLNLARYRNPELDALIERIERAVAIEQRIDLYRQAEQLLIADAPAIWIYASRYVDFLSPDIRGVVIQPGRGATRAEQWYRN